LTFLTSVRGFPDLNKPTLSHLMRPVQRVMKYPLLLSEMQKQAARSDTVSRFTITVSQSVSQ
jgi:hypothetical protein